MHRPARQGAWKRALRGMRAVLAIVLPVALVAGARELGGDAIPSWLVLAACVYSVVGVVIWIEPELPAKLGLVKQAGEAFTSWNPKK